MPEKYVQVDGLATFVRHVGPTTLPERPPELSRGETLVCLHGAGGEQRASRASSSALGRRTARSRSTCPGHARSGGLDASGSWRA